MHCTLEASHETPAAETFNSGVRSSGRNKVGSRRRGEGDEGVEGVKGVEGVSEEVVGRKAGRLDCSRNNPE